MPDLNKIAGWETRLITYEEAAARLHCYFHPEGFHAMDAISDLLVIALNSGIKLEEFHGLVQKVVGASIPVQEEELQ